MNPIFGTYVVDNPGSPEIATAETQAAIDADGGAHLVFDPVGQPGRPRARDIIFDELWWIEVVLDDQDEPTSIFLLCTSMHIGCGAIRGTLTRSEPPSADGRIHWRIEIPSESVTAPPLYGPELVPERNVWRDGRAEAVVTRRADNVVEAIDMWIAVSSGTQ
ncbi:hypothetical protein [Microbacterium sp. ZW T5_56]|uniref:hypothetical protein n=1 Tax=Microbacterium sp. ZW T5_56 TaxID=3378081 RepID=UPI0038537112